MTKVMNPNVVCILLIVGLVIAEAATDPRCSVQWNASCSRRNRRVRYVYRDGVCRPSIACPQHSFTSRSSCYNACRDQTSGAAVVSQDTLQQCSLPPETGHCRARFRRYHFDRVEGRCKQFTYGGCGGNANNFQTESQCMQSCGASPRCPIYKLKAPDPGCHYEDEPDANFCPKPRQVCPNNAPSAQEVLRQCSLAPEKGKCRAKMTRFYYNRISGRCERFVYGGCGANDNNFQTSEQCMQFCGATPRCPVYRLVAPNNGCHYEDELNANLCPTPKLVCPPTSTPAAAADLKVQRTCRLPSQKGTCGKSLVRWYYKGFDRCESFLYSGCGGNENNFDSKEECMNTCKGVGPCAVPGMSAPPEGCHYVDVIQENGCPFPELVCNGGACAGYPCSGVCNICINNADSNGYTCKRNTTCEASNPCMYMRCRNCKVISGVGKCIKDLPLECQQPKQPGPCKAYMPSFYYDSGTKTCERFIYGGCQGNDNRFKTRQWCERVCIRKQECLIPPVARPPPGCNYVNVIQENGCPFPELVCNGGACAGYPCSSVCDICINNAVSDDYTCKRNTTCEASNPCMYMRCRNCKVISGVGKCIKDLPLECQQPKQPGPCEAYMPSFYYDNGTKTCERFVYGGCQGNGNRFKTRQWCERVCIRKQECRIPPIARPPPGCNYKQDLDQEGCTTFELVCTKNSHS